MELIVVEHGRYDAATLDFVSWLESTTEKLQDLHNLSGSRDQLEARLAKIKVDCPMIIKSHDSLSCFSSPLCRESPVKWFHCTDAYKVSYVSCANGGPI